MKAPTAWLEAPEAWLEAPEDWLEAPEAWLEAPEAWLEGRDTGRTDGRTHRFPLLYRTSVPFSPLRGRCPKSSYLPIR